jgi:hypothetical protein
VDVTEAAHHQVSLARPSNDAELYAWMHHTWNVRFPDKVFQAVADAYFARHSPVHVWIASRALGGKTFTQAVLKATEAVTLGCHCAVIAGSSEQAGRMTAYVNPNVSASTIWSEERAPNAPRWLLPRITAVRKMRFRNGAVLETQTTSTKSARGGHPARLSVDEVDEMKIRVLTSAIAQTKVNYPALLGGKERVEPCTVLSSTRQYPDGAMQWALKTGGKKGWHITEWTYRDTLHVPDHPEQQMGWALQPDVQALRDAMPDWQWEAEVENQEPNPAGRAINPEKVKLLFRRAWMETEAELGSWTVEKCDPNGRYAVGADWGRKRDKTVIVVFRTDVRPFRAVYLYRQFRTSWPEMLAAYDLACETYHVGARACHDGTAMGGDMVSAYIKAKKAEAVQFMGQRRKDMLTEYVKACEDEAVAYPYVSVFEAEHRYLTNASIYGGQQEDIDGATRREKEHVGDTVVAGAMAWRAARRSDIILR